MSRADKGLLAPGAKAARKGEKKRRAQEKTARQTQLRNQLKAADAQAEQTRQALSEAEAALRERRGPLSRELRSVEEAESGLLGRLGKGIARTRAHFSDGLSKIVRGASEIAPEVLDQLEELLLTSDVGTQTSERLLQAVRRQMRREEVSDGAKLVELLKREVQRVLQRRYEPLRLDAGHPTVILFVGVNGTGKTTTIGKLAAQVTAQGKKVLLAAGDTFRAAAAEQLGQWSTRVGAELFAAPAGTDPSGVIYQALEQGKAHGVDLVLCDTAGRLHTKTHLMEELKKIKRVLGKLDVQAPHETLLVLDANTGQNAIHQTRDFHAAVGLTGLVMTKLDGTARGGVVVGIVNEFDLPIRYLGLGEGVEDLQPFVADHFARELLG